VSDLVVHGGRVLPPLGPPHAGWLLIRGGRIDAVGQGEPPAVDAPALDLAGRLAAPGFVDLHVHGGDGVDFSSANAQDISRALAFHARHGTTSLLATTPSSAPEPLLRAVREIAGAGERGVLGAHLEGPFINRERAGAQDPRHIRDPDLDELGHLLEAGEGAVRMVTLAPELPRALEAIAGLRDAGAVASVGHSDATWDVARAAFAAGAAHAVHLFNAMRPLHHREPGVIGAALADPAVTCELVCDGFHLHAGAIALVHRLKGADGAVLVTDAITAAGLPDGEHRVGGLAVDVRDGRATLAQGGSLAGSTLTMDGAVRGAVRAGVPVGDALRMASATPARVIGLDGAKGALAPGHDADVVVLDDDLTVHVTIAGGQVVQGRSAPA
jgi:N-acetylglucosamine-6-phosphate deacetylase